MGIRLRAPAAVRVARSFLFCLVSALVAFSLISPSPVAVAAGSDTPVPALLLGAAWYPEQWPESRWDADLQLMEDAHLHVVRVGEFAWSTLEPSEGRYDLDWLARAVRLAEKHHIEVVIGTPTDAPPAWLTSAHPETLRVDAHWPPRRARRPPAIQLRESGVSRLLRSDRRTARPPLWTRSKCDRLANRQ